MNIKIFHNYINNYCQDIDTFIKPLKQFGINYFSFSRVYKDGRIVFLCNDKDWLTVKCELKLFEYNGFFPDEKEIVNNYDVHIFTGDIDTMNNNKLFKFLFENNKWNSLDIYYRHTDYVDVAHFSSSKSNERVVNFYLNNIDYLRTFFNDFKIRFSREINLLSITKDCLNLKLFHNKKIDTIINDKLFINNEKKQTNYNISNPDLDDTTLFRIRDIPMIIDGKNVALTNRETECYILLSQGKTSKGIAKILNLSPRTVETHINNIKTKTGINYKSLLIDKFYTTYGKVLSGFWKEMS